MLPRSDAAHRPRHGTYSLIHQNVSSRVTSLRDKFGANFRGD